MSQLDFENSLNDQQLIAVNCNAVSYTHLRAHET